MFNSLYTKCKYLFKIEQIFIFMLQGGLCVKYENGKSKCVKGKLYHAIPVKYD